MLISFISSCNCLHEKQKSQVELNLIALNEVQTPKELQLLLESYPEIRPEQFMLRFKSNSRFDDWIHAYPSQMAKSITYFPLNSSRELATELFTFWANENYDASEAYIENELNGSPLRDAAIEGMVNGLKSNHLSTAVAWAHEISDQSKRYQLLESLATR